MHQEVIQDAKMQLNAICAQASKGLVTKKDYNNKIFNLLYKLLYSEQFK